MNYIIKNGSRFNDKPSTLAYLSLKTLADGNGNLLDETYTQKIDVNYIIDIQNNAAFHNSIFMGRDITGKFSNGSLYTNITNGTFEDIFVGDYFTASYAGANKVFRIAGFNSLYNQGDSNVLTRNHVVIVPDEPLANAAMNTSNSSTNGYASMSVRSGAIATINTNLNATFSGHLITKRELLCNATNSAVSAGMSTTTGSSSNWAWYDSKSELMSEMEIYGTSVFNASGYDVASGYSQFPLFALAPEFISMGYNFWLRGVANSAKFTICRSDGRADMENASVSAGIRPRIAIG